MAKYTEEELLSYESHACLPDGVDLGPFLQLIENVREALKQLDEQNPHRRKSFTFAHKQYKKKQPKEVVDEDGWTSFLPKKTKKDEINAILGISDDNNESNSNNAGDDNAIDDDVEEEKVFKQHTMKIKTSSSKISSGKSGVADSRDTIALTQVSKFNAFDALGDDDDE